MKSYPEAWERYCNNCEENNLSQGLHMEDLFILLEESEKIPQGGTYVEIGVSNGSSLLAVSQFRPDVKCYGIEIGDFSPATQMIAKLDIKNVELFFGKGAEVVCKTWDKEIDLLFIDGEHYFPNIFWDYVGWSPFVKNSGAFIFHDMEPLASARFDVAKALQIFLDNPKYTSYFPALQDIISSSMVVVKKQTK